MAWTVLAYGWLALCVGLGIWGVVLLWREHWYDGPFFCVLFTVFGAAIVALVGLFPIGFLVSVRSPDLAILKNGEWTCTASHTQLQTMTTLVGKTLVVQTIPRTVCDRYERLAK